MIAEPPKLVAVFLIAKGQVITEDMIWTKRPGTGIPSKDYPKLLGKKAKTDIPVDTLVRWDQIEA